MYVLNNPEIISLTPEKIVERAKIYIKRAKNSRDKELMNYEEKQVSHWLITSAIQDSNGRRDVIMPIVHGKFIDAVRYAVQQYSFYYSPLSGTNKILSDWRSGEVKKVKISDLEDILAKIINEKI